MENENLLILIKLLVAHIVGDFILQTDKWVKHKEDHKLKSRYLYLHSLLHGLLAYVFIASFANPLVPILIAAAHLIIDIFKLQLKKRFIYFALDQFLHLLSILILWMLFYQDFQYIQIYFLRLISDYKLWIIGTAYIIAFWPTAILINQFTLKWQTEINKGGDTSLPNAGKWIGRLERILILTFILVNQFEAIGFLIAAKSVFRFGDLRDESDRKRTEYILIGTLVSFTITIGIGLLVEFMI
jgi:hypothetical protein